MEAQVQKASKYQGEVWGILGGMGPLASAEFVKTIYEEYAGHREQELPVVFLLSDSTMPDRTQYLLTGNDHILLERFLTNLNQLVAIGATKIIVCCITIHSLIPRLPAGLQEKIISLVDVTLNSVLQSGQNYLLICTRGTRESGLFQKHELWPRVMNQIVFPTEEDQDKIHAFIYEMKSNKRSVQPLEFLLPLLKRYEVSSYIAGCTELHILAGAQERITGQHLRLSCIDPLKIVASLISRSSRSLRAY